MTQTDGLGLRPLLAHVAYTPPGWARGMRAPLHGRIVLSHAPTPVMPWRCPALAELGVEWSIKRDDLSGLELSGNKARKLEFLLAEATAGGHDCIVTVGGMQSNHCRATAAAARLVGLEPHVVLLASDSKADDDPGLEGNLLVDRMLGATIHICAASDYFKAGGDLSAMKTIASEAAQQLRREGRNPYVIPVGASNALGTWGYVDAVEELRQQFRLDDGEALPFDHIVMTTGSAGSAAGVAIGAHLSGLGARVHAVCVNGSVDEKYAEIGAIGEDMCCWAAGEGSAKARELITIHDGAGRGYGVSQRAELEFAAQVGPASGVLFDPIYTGKGLYYFCEAAKRAPDQFRNTRVLWWHTGGMFAMWAKSAELQPLLPESQVRRLRLPHEPTRAGFS
ncbi:hypothetical protein AB1Y20_011140 [Prymnesium parvum]|uniref:Tryptophan synthase beta chain-like PALP domain-containing protein n=1 Tax=Prymnesium parvum TaxID=97485 RepID=A0AB34IM23_PRYPA